jgi:thiol-disulfide isomerase/thioredoxin
MERPAEQIDHDRRRYVGRLAATIAGAGLGVFGIAQAIDRESRDFSGLDRATAWLNSPRLTASSLAGKVVLVDFCTYTCINWLRTLPYLRAWAQKYRQTLVVIGVHTPEYPFEQDIDNVRRAVRQMAIEYPIAIDNEYAIWRAFRNQYWPALFFVDARGRVRDHHFGEGKYEQSERTTQKLLAEAGGSASGTDLVSVAGQGVEAAADWGNLRSPENYLGFAKTEGFVSPGGAQLDRPHVYASPARLALNQWALAGEWTVTRGRVALNAANGRLRYRFHARDVHLVMGAARQPGPVRFRVSLDGQAPGAAHGVDADAAGNGMVMEARLYQLIRQTTPIVARQFDIEFLDAGVEAFAFTFG